MADFTQGARFDAPESGIHGVIDQVVLDPVTAEPAALVIRCDNGIWTTVDATLIETVTLH